MDELKSWRPADIDLLYFSSFILKKITEKSNLSEKNVLVKEELDSIYIDGIGN